MDPREHTKFFDVARPSQVNPSSTSRPVIVGHQPMMVDPMVRGAANSRTSPGVLNTTPTSEPQFSGHTAKVIQVSDQMESEIKSDTPQPAPINQVVPPMPPVGPTGIGEIPVMPSATAAAPTPAQIPLAPDETSSSAGHPPVAAATLVPTPDLSHIPHIPVSHSSSHSPGKLKHLLLWIIVIGVLGAFAGFLAIDAGLISSSVHLPFHIFSRQA
jgi:hypothetical protein